MEEKQSDILTVFGIASKGETEDEVARMPLDQMYQDRGEGGQGVKKRYRKKKRKKEKGDSGGSNIAVPGKGRGRKKK